MKICLNYGVIFEFKKEELFNIYGYKEDFYGLMWYTGEYELWTPVIRSDKNG